MRLPLNATVDLVVYSAPSTLADRGGQCDTLGHCRTVWNITWSCLITIFVCIWVAVHPNIPQPKPPLRNYRFEGPLPRRASRAWVRFKAWTLWDSFINLSQRLLPEMLAALGEKLAIALLALRAPEFIFVWALRQWLRAHSIVKACQRAATTAYARDWRKQRRSENPLITARERADFERLEAVGSNNMTSGQYLIYDILRQRIQATGKENEDQPNIEASDEVGKSTFHACHKAFFTSFIQHGPQHTDSSFSWAGFTSLMAINPLITFSPTRSSP